MKTLHLLIIIIFSASLGISNHGAFADNPNNIEIQDIKVQPSAIKVGDAIKITVTLVNNSPDPIYVSDQGSHDCEGAFFTVMFDKHVNINETGVACSYVALVEKLDSGKKYTGTSPGIGLAYIATEGGTVNATVTFPYEVRNQTDPNQSGIWKTISKSFLFTINDNNTLNGITGITFGSSTPSFIIKNETPLQQSLHGTAPKDVICNQDFQLVIKSEDGSPACVKPDTAITLVEHGWATNVPQPNPMTGLNNDTGIATLGNHAYYFETPNYTQTTVLDNPTQISFHDVTFTLFPSGFRGGLPAWGCGGGYYWADAKFSDGTSELLQIFVGSKDCFLPQPSTHFSTHANPQAGLTFYGGKMKLLVSVKNQPVGMVSIQPTSSLANPGGPEIRLTLKNIGVTPITSLKAILQLNNDYTFDFKNVSESQPLSSGNLISDTKILIGAGFSSESSYPITISGIANDTIFSYTENIHIH